jgi:nitrate reductase assembly molybdenum cofactor insertion protein NarJ
MPRAKRDLDSPSDQKEGPDMQSRKQYHALAQVFAFPSEGYRDHVAACQALLDRAYPDAAAKFSRFSAFVAGISDWECEEIYTKTFHIQAICYLDLGYVIFGEDYKRGEFLVHMKDEQAKVDNDCGSELPDNLANVLELMSRTEDEEFLQELALRVLQPALVTMIAEFDDARMQLREKVLKKLHKALLQQNLLGGNIYRDALAALQGVLEQDYAGISYDDPEPHPSIGGAFLKNCSGGGCGTDPLHTPVKQDLSVGML